MTQASALLSKRPTGIYRDPLGGLPSHYDETLQKALTRNPFNEMRASFDPKVGLLHCRFTFKGRPCFRPAVVDDIHTAQALAARYQSDDGLGNTVRYLCFGSDEPGVLSLGGDLELFSTLIRARDHAGLTAYAQAVVDLVYRNHTAVGQPMITIALVQGQALGGGFEGALSTNILIAERRARFGFPEILFNLFPGMGAYSLLARRIAPALAERMILSGQIYTAEELHTMGIVDVLCEDGEGESALYGYMARTEQGHAVQCAVSSARRRVNPLTRIELDDIAADWVDLALKLSERDLNIMTRLVSAQHRRRAREAETA